jgi:predicted GH43/DUF377 family glycosyl hydrolase
MDWEKLGLVYTATGEQTWAQSHAFLPTSMMLDDERIRVYVAFLDRERVGRVGFVDVAARDPRKILNVSEQPVLGVGRAGAFDESGVTPMCIVKSAGRIFLYYTGWQLGKQVRYYLFTGLAVSDDGGASFQRHSEAPVLDRSDGELFIRTAPHVLSAGGRWQMWYIAGEQWIETGGKQLPSYNLRYLESTDPAVWGKRGRVLMEPDGAEEFGFGRPFVVHEDNRFRMWYSVRLLGKGYRLGYAESADGLNWERKDEQVGIDVSASGWDSEMICFSGIQKTKFGTYLFYNGNNYGETGFGVARLQDRTNAS